MEITKVEFIKSVFDIKELPHDNFPQIAFAGRSNVGKSSLINTLVNQKNLAKISKTPGKTRALNFFKINNRFYFVDLPGYGYAKVSKSVKSGWGDLIENYLKNSPNLKGLIQILDSRHPPTDDDMEMVEFLDFINLKYLIVLTKSDKLSPKETSKNAEKFKQILNNEDIVFFSAKTKEGKNKILGWIKDLL